ncbi:large subunit ribosomal protein L27e [Nematocida sp. LUAm3]|nr:large subunit ribosomal protein L27e [Nematocida sp. LUAm3]KAI5173665.1 large subunit ribosomal protein L27e [Nematocida sp. LUAm2]KAI5176886.1 large subunit ribosomal protein L27e [Nematocida sp. LUAm1]
MLTKDEVVLLTKGRYAGMKAVIVEEISEHNGRTVVTVVGLEKVPRPITEDMTERQKKKHGSMRGFIKKMNIRHILATRYTMENVFEKLEIKDLTDTSERTVMRKEVEKCFKNAYANNSEHWVFKRQKI